MGQLVFHIGHILRGDRLVHGAVMKHLGRSVVSSGNIRGGFFDVGRKGHLRLATHTPHVEGAVGTDDIRDHDVVWQNPRLALGAVQGLGDLLDDLVDVVVVHFFCFR